MMPVAHAGGDQLRTVVKRRLPIGAEPMGGGRTHFRVWAPRCKTVSVVFDSDPCTSHALVKEAGGYFSNDLPAGIGALYRFELNKRGNLHCDPASRFQPQGPNGPSEVIDASSFDWTDAAWRGPDVERQVLYEMHFGTFTPEGTYQAAMEQLPALADVGITCLEVMPVADFAGTFGWGYDGVNFFAPTRLYGRPDDFRRFVDRAHSLDIAVILDVVYNHVGPEGNCFAEFAEQYFTDRHKNDWGKSINFDGDFCAPVREYFLANARYWITEFHLDGFRFDATQAILDDSPSHILADIASDSVEAAGERKLLLVAENEPQHTVLVRPRSRGGYGLTALWNDDFHHSATVALTGRHEAYYTDYRGSPQEFISSAKWGYLFQGQNYAWQKSRRGSAAFDLPPRAFVNFIENHDQIANSARGFRTLRLSSPPQHRAVTALLLLSPQTPMLFQGQEFNASAPFFYFADFKNELAKQVREGRADSLAQFPSIGNPATRARLRDPADRETFNQSKLDPIERQTHKATVDLHRDLLRLRREDAALRGRWPGGFDGAVLSEFAFVFRFFTKDGNDRIAIFNLGPDHLAVPAPEPLLAPPDGKEWEIAWHSEDPKYDGTGVVPLDNGMIRDIQAHSAMLLRPRPEASKRVLAPVAGKV